MGIGIVLLFWFFIGLIAAAVGAIVLAGGMAVLTRKTQSGRGRAILWSAALPFIGLCWWAGVFVFQATINGMVFHKDPGLGDGWETPLPNGYILTMIDVTERGWVTKTGEREMGPAVSDLQIAGRYVLGKYEQANQSGSFFLLDTATDKHQTFADLEALRKATKPLGIQPALQPFNHVYQRYRTGWFDYFALLLYLVYPVGALAFWVRLARNVRNESTSEDWGLEPRMD